MGAISVRGGKAFNACFSRPPFWVHHNLSYLLLSIIGLWIRFAFSFEEIHGTEGSGIGITEKA